MLFLKQPLILAVLCHKSATTSQIDSYKVSNSKLRPDLCNCVKKAGIESTAPPQQPYKRGSIFLGNSEGKSNIAAQKCTENDVQA